MAHRYGLPITVEIGPDGAPIAFTWHGAEYRVAQVLATWHLQDRWWASIGSTRGPSDRLYFRVETPDHQIFDVFHDHEQSVWILDVAHD